MTDECTLIEDFILENELVSEDALELALACAGRDVETLNYIIYHETGYHDIPQLFDCEHDNFMFNDEVISYYCLDEETEEYTKEGI